MEIDYSSLPSLATFIAHLSAILSSSAVPSSIFIHSPSNAALLPHILASIISTSLPNHEHAVEKPSVQALLPKAAFIDLRLITTPKAILEGILNQLSGWPQAWNDKEGRVRSWDGRRAGIEVVGSQRGKKRKAVTGKEKASGKRPRLEQGEDTVIPAGDNEAHQDEELSTWKLQWSISSLPPKTVLEPVKDSLDAFHAGLGSLFALKSITEDTPDEEERRFIVFEHGELLHEIASATGGKAGAAKDTGLAMTFVSTLYKLEELSGKPITVIVLSSLSWIKAKEGMVGVGAPTIFAFPSLSPQDTVAILTHRFSSSFVASSEEEDKSSQIKVTLFSSLSMVLQQYFGSYINTDLESLSYLTAKFWPHWLNCVEGPSKISPRDVARLTSNLKESFQAEFALISEPQLSLSSSSTPITNLALPSPAPSPTKIPVLSTNLIHSLGTIPRLLLVAAFFVANNPPKSDIKTFVKIDENAAKRGKKERKQKAIKPGTQKKAAVRQDLLGGKAFPVERLVAIFEAILDDHQEYLARTTDVAIQISVLINLRLLTRVTPPDRVLEGMKLKCKLSRDTVDVLARSIGMGNWQEYLYNADD